MTRFYCGVDIGGTFTDCVLLDESGALVQGKALTTPGRLASGFLGAIADAGAQLDLDAEEVLGSTRTLFHGTTVATNAVVQMSGAKTGLVTTRGHGDALRIMRSAGRSVGLPVESLLHISRHHVKPAAIVPRTLVKEVNERVDWEGDVIVPLDEDDARIAVLELVEEGVEAIAISFLWGFINSAHEQRVREIVQEIAPDVFVSCAHMLTPVVGEYERTAATVLNAYIGPVTSSYLSTIGGEVAGKGYERPVLIMQAAGGVASAERSSQAPLFTIGSGPVGGLAGAEFLARQTGHANVVATDLGGTSFDVGIIAGGTPLRSSEMAVNKYTFLMPRLDIESIGAGGGSIIWADAGSRTLRIGPESAGADPGPAAYGKGGTRPTVTDANVVLGYYAEGAKISGGIELDRDAAFAAIAEVAGRVGLSPMEAAAGVKRIVDERAAMLIRQMTVERGLDPRDFVVYAYGGAAGLHAAEYSRALGAKTIVVPLGNLASGWSALGIVDADLLRVYEQHAYMKAPFDPRELTGAFAELEAAATEELGRDGVSPGSITFSRSAEMKFGLQINHVEVEVGPGDLSDADMEYQVARFVDRYEKLYGEGSAFLGAGVDITMVRLRAQGTTGTPGLQRLPTGASATPVGERAAHWESNGSATTLVYDGAKLTTQASVVGPALVQFPSTVVAIPPGDRGTVDEFGSLVIELGRVR